MRGLCRSGRIVLFVGAAMLIPAAASAAGTPDDHTVPDITITAEKPPVEQGEKSIFTSLPPRELFQRPLTESPGLDTSTSIVGREEIDWLDASSVVEAMRYVPGAWTESRGRKVKQFFSIRGQRYPYPGYSLDGAWFREFHELPSFLDPGTLDRIEILRSSSAMLHGPGGMTGMINLVPRDYTQPQGRFETIYGSHNTSRSSLSYGDAAGRYSYSLGAGFRHTDGPSNEHAGENISSFFARVTSKPSDDLTLSLTTLMFTGDRELRAAQAPASPALIARREIYDPMHAYMVVGKADYHPNDFASTEVIVNYGLKRFDYHLNNDPVQLEEDYEYGLNVIQTLKLSEDNTLRFGGLYNRWVSPTGKRFYLGRRGDLSTYSGVIVDEHKFGDLTLNAGAQLSRTYVEDFGGYSIEGSAAGLATVRTHNEWEDPLGTFTLGAGYALTEEYSLHGNFTWGQIDARKGMLNDRLETPGTETRCKYDLGVKRSWDTFGEAMLTAFFVDQKDAPLLSRNTVTIAGIDYGLFENDDRDSYGLELDVRSKRFQNGVQFFANAVAMNTHRQRVGHWERDKEVPRFIVGGGASWLINRIEFSAFVKNVSRYENERFLPGGSDPVGLGRFTDVGAKVAYYFGAKKQHNVFIGVENICDREYSTVVGYPDTGRRYLAGVAMTF